MCRWHRSDEGAVALVAALTMVVLVTLVALVIDIALLRLDRRNSQRTSDVAVVAGALALDGGTPQEACQAALDYVTLNTPAAGALSPSDPCSAWPSSPACPSTPFVAQASAGDVSIEIMWPVPDDDGLMEGRTHEMDGDPCERMAVSVQRARDLLFAPLIGHDRESTTADAVATSAADSPLGDIASLVVLDQTGCEPLIARGNGRIHVREVPNWVDPLTGEVKTLPGIITVDSDASAGCDASTPAVESEGTNSDIRAGGVDGDIDESDDKGMILSYALESGGGPAYDPDDVADGRLSTEPVPGDRVTRSVVDARWGETVADLLAAVGDFGAPADFSFYTGGCTVTTEVTLSGNVYIACDPLTIDPKGSVTITDGDVVANGPIVVKGAMSVNASASAPHWMVIRNGDLEKASGATLTLEQVAVVLDNGRIRLEGSDAGSLTWIAPETPGADFDLEDLALWSESSAVHRLAGQSLLTLEGVWFAPNAVPFEFAGGNSAAITVFQTKAQFITWRFDVSGNGELVMEPDPEHNIETQPAGITLIR